MFSYDEADITYSVMWGKLDGSSDIDYTYDLNQKEARIYTKARMLGQDLDEVMDTYRIEREIIRYEKSEYDSDIRNARVSIWFCYNQEQPPIEDVKEYLKNLLTLHRITSAREVVNAQINVFEDTDNDWNKIALDLAMEVNCPGYAKRYQGSKFNKKIWDKDREELLKTLSKQKPAKRDKKGNEVLSVSTYVNNPWVDKYPKPKCSEEEMIERRRGCKDITKPDDKQLHIITKSGKEVVIDAIPPFELKFYGDGFCPFNTYDWASPGYKDGCLEGVWGFLNPEGEIIIEPEYYYVCGPYGSYDDEYCLVCKNWYGDYAWGVLDCHGKEILPCLPYKYSDLQQTMYGSKYFDVFIYAPRREVGHFDVRGKYHGLIKRDGTVILEPQFYYINSHNFNWEHKLFLAGMSNFQYGVYSLELNRFITSDRCSHVKFNDEARTLECEYSELHFDRPNINYKAVYGYDGNLISSEIVNR